MLDINKIRAQFPILNRKVNGKDLVYFDNGATTQKPQSVIDAEANYYTCLLYTSPSPRDRTRYRMPSSA